MRLDESADWEQCTRQELGAIYIYVHNLNCNDTSKQGHTKQG